MAKVKKHWISAPDLRKWLQDQIYLHLREIQDMWKHNNYEAWAQSGVSVPPFGIYWNHRMFSVAGRANYIHNWIEINSSIFIDKNPETNKELANTIIHEYCHLIAPRDHHGSIWKSAMQIFGVKPERCHDIPEAKERQRKWERYEVSCPSCQEQWGITATKIRRWKKHNAKLHCLKCKANVPISSLPDTP